MRYPAQGRGGRKPVLLETEKQRMEKIISIGGKISLGNQTLATFMAKEYQKEKEKKKKKKEEEQQQQKYNCISFL